jgi:hypothetical protein
MQNLGTLEAADNRGTLPRRRLLQENPRPGVVCCRKIPGSIARASVVNLLFSIFSVDTAVSAADTFSEDVGLRVAVTWISSMPSTSCASTGTVAMHSNVVNASLRILTIADSGRKETVQYQELLHTDALETPAS